MLFFSFAGGTKGSESGGLPKVNSNTSAVAPEWWWKNEIKGEMGWNWNAAKIDPRAVVEMSNANFLASRNKIVFGRVAHKIYSKSLYGTRRVTSASSLLHPSSFQASRDLSIMSLSHAGAGPASADGRRGWLPVSVTDT